MEYSRFKQLAEKVKERAREKLLQTGEVPLTLFIVKSNDQIKIIELAHEVPQPIHETIRDTVRRLDGTAVVVVGEAWMTEISGDQAPASGDPTRMEILMVEAIHSEGSISWVMRISREGGRIACGRAQRLEEGDTVFGGGLSDILTR
ncbi:MAG: hypothetical protein ACE5MK_12275 [Acidobacteriota bacterium]